MPWLVKDEENPQKELLFVHVPRCGGTSLIKHFDVERKARSEENCYHWCGLIYFFYRYRLLESANFPWKSYENLISLTMFIIAWIVYFADEDWAIKACDPLRWCPPPLSVSFWITSVFGVFLNTFVMNAPVMGRNDYLRRLQMWFFGTIACEFAATYKWLHGVGSQGFMMHYTAPKLISHGFVTRDRIESAHCFAIVRNPYSRMFSIYKYNRYGDLEGFEHFVKEWYEKWKRYKKKGSTEEWDAYCHVLQMKEFTHDEDGNQIIPYIIRQEDLNELTKKGGATEKNVQIRYSNLPEIVLEALKGMPHSNARSTKKHWSEYYNQKTMDLVYEMYRPDFQEFSYSTSIPKRDDLKPRESFAPRYYDFQASSRRLVDKSLFDFPVDCKQQDDEKSLSVIAKLNEALKNEGVDTANEELNKESGVGETPDEIMEGIAEKIEVVVSHNEECSNGQTGEEVNKVDGDSKNMNIGHNEKISDLTLEDESKPINETPNQDV